MTPMRSLLLLAATTLALAPVSGWAKDTTAVVDTTRLLSDQPVKSPTGAMLRSAILPGWGQLYNQRYWKAGLAVAVNGALVGRALYFSDRYETVKLPDGRRDRAYLERRNNYLWLFGLAYLITIADAYVDAYLFGFDAAMDVAALPAAGWRVGIAIRF